jgi:hypothetical protein
MNGSFLAGKARKDPFIAFLGHWTAPAFVET